MERCPRPHRAFRYPNPRYHSSSRDVARISRQDEVAEVIDALDETNPRYAYEKGPATLQDAVVIPQGLKRSFLEVLDDAERDNCREGFVTEGKSGHVSGDEWQIDDLFLGGSQGPESLIDTDHVRSKVPQICKDDGRPTPGFEHEALAGYLPRQRSPYRIR